MTKRNLRRKAPTREPATIMIVVTEGTKTEPGYLKAFKEIHVLPYVRKSIFDLRVIPEGATPRKVVDRAIEKLESLQGPFSRKDSVWAMFDRDEHPDFEEVKDKARKKGVRLAVSDPCFEIWGIYHYEDWQRHIERDKCQKEFERLCPSYSRSSRKIFKDKYIIKNNYHDAIERAESLLRSRRQDDDPERNPSTTVHCLIKEILSRVEELRNGDESNG